MIKMKIKDISIEIKGSQTSEKHKKRKKRIVKRNIKIYTNITENSENKKILNINNQSKKLTEKI